VLALIGQGINCIDIAPDVENGKVSTGDPEFQTIKPNKSLNFKPNHSLSTRETSLSIQVEMNALV